MRIRKTGLSTVSLVLLAGAVAGCGGTSRVLQAKALPVQVSSSQADWGLDVMIQPTPDAINVQLVNRSAAPVTVVWDESAYIDIDSRSHQILTSAGNSASGPRRSSIAPGTRLDEVLTPVSGPNDSRLDPLLPSKDDSSWWQMGMGGGDEKPRLGAEINDETFPLLGKEIGLFLVLERQGERKTVLAKYAIVEGIGN